MEKASELKKDRIEVVDILRGFALLGIIIFHFTEQYYLFDANSFWIFYLFLFGSWTVGRAGSASLHDYQLSCLRLSNFL